MFAGAKPSASHDDGAMTRAHVITGSFGAGKTTAIRWLMSHKPEHELWVVVLNEFTEAGIDAWADRNDIVVLYPYAVKSQTNPLNPNGCWHWWGYDDPSYALQSGTQISIVYKMVQRIMGR